MTKEIRHQIYVKALDLYINVYNSSRYINMGRVGLCYVIYSAILSLNLEDVADSPYLYEDNLVTYREIFKQKPEKLYDESYWWNVKNTEIRIAVLKQAIEKSI